MPAPRSSDTLPVEATVAVAEIDAAEPLEAAVKKRLGVGAWLAIVWLVVVVFVTVFAGVLPLRHPENDIDGLCARQGPTATHWFGCDGNGRDLLSRVAFGSRASLMVSTAAIAVGMLAGGFLGLMAGYYRGRVEAILTGLFDTLLAIPQLVLALALVSVLASGEDVSSERRRMVLIVALGLVSIPILARITRANTLAWSQREFVLAARAQGAKNRRIIWQEVLPNVLPAMFSIALLGIAVVIVAEGGLSILGVGVQLPTPSWGNVIAEGRAQLRDAPHVVFFPSGAIFLTVLALNYLGDVIRDRFDVRESAL